MKHQRICSSEQKDKYIKPMSPEIDVGSSVGLSADKLAEYRRDLKGLDMTETQKAELIETLWIMMGAFVDRSFDATENHNFRRDTFSTEGPPHVP